MSLLRVAFERADRVAQMVVLCAGCYHAFMRKLLDDDSLPVRHWARPFEGGGMCEFCLEEARRSAVE